MKKLFLLSLIVLVVNACTKDVYQHSFAILHPTNSSLVLFADQTSDSIVLYTTDYYKLTPVESWITLGSMSEMPSNVHYVYRNLYQFSVPMTIEPNDTKKTRTGFVNVVSNGADDWSVSGAVAVKQYGWHNIKRPRIVDLENGEYPTIQLNDSAKQEKDSIRFETHDTWKLIASDFVTVDTNSGNEGEHKVGITLQPNTTGAERKTVIKLMTISDGVTTEITVKQAK